MAIAMIAGVWQGVAIERFVQSYTTKAYSDLSERDWTEALILDRQGRVITTLALQIQGPQAVLFSLPEALYIPLVTHLQIYCKIMRISMHIFPIPSSYTPKTFYPWITQSHLSGVFTAHDLSSDVLGLINFQKGCYVGQEIVVRVQSRVVEHKNRLAMISIQKQVHKYKILYSQNQFTIGVLPRESWGGEDVIYVWDKAEK